jgi:hypothetical protein
VELKTNLEPFGSAARMLVYHLSIMKVGTKEIHDA